jgi:hypothetical protein
LVFPYRPARCWMLDPPTHPWMSSRGSGGPTCHGVARSVKPEGPERVEGSTENSACPTHPPGRDRSRPYSTVWL